MAKTDKPNILIIWGDDIGWFNISAYTAVVYWMFRGKQRKGYTPTSAPPSTVKRS